jgi:hypothetical protein
LTPDAQTDQELQTFVTQAIWRHLGFGLAMTSHTYMIQRKTSELIIERIQIKAQQDQLRDLFDSLKDGIIVASNETNEDEDDDKSRDNKPPALQKLVFCNATIQ